MRQVFLCASLNLSCSTTGLTVRQVHRGLLIVVLLRLPVCIHKYSDGQNRPAFLYFPSLSELYNTVTHSHIHNMTRILFHIQVLFSILLYTRI